MIPILGQISLTDIGTDVEGVATAVGDSTGSGVMTCLTIAGTLLVVGIVWRWLASRKGARSS